MESPPLSKFSYQDDPEVVEVAASDCQTSFSNKKNKRKVVDCDVIEIGEDEDLMIIGDNVSTSNKAQEKSIGYNHKVKDKAITQCQNWANQVKESLTQDFMTPGSATKLGWITGSLNPVKSSVIGFDYVNNLNEPPPMYGFNNFHCSFNDTTPTLQAPLDGMEFKTWLTLTSPLMEQPAEIPSKLVNSGSLPISNLLSSSRYTDKKDEVWLQQPPRSKKNPASTSYATFHCQPSHSRDNQEDKDEVLNKYRSFKRFDIVGDYADHFYANQSSKARQPPQNWAKVIQQEWKILKKDLPDTIFVRVYEEKMDLLRAVIVGAAGTPYHDGLFFFDFFFPSSYPSVPPQVHYHSGGLRLNPNLYNCGKVCLSLLNTWQGRKEEMWTPKKSTVLQVLLSVQALVLNAKPFFNEPGYAHMAGRKEGEIQAHAYNESTYILSCKTILYTLNRPPKHFEEFVVGHFREHAHAILVACKAYMDGAQIGCLAGGGVQDVDEGDGSSSQNFKTSVGPIVHNLFAAFVKNGSRDCEQFRPQNRNTVVDTIQAASGSWGQFW